MTDSFLTDTLLLLLTIMVVWDASKIDRIEKLLRKPEPKQSVTPMVTPTNPLFVNQNAVGQGDSVIVEPKSPALVQWEEEEELRKLNLKPR